MHLTRHFKNKLTRRGNPKITSSAALTSVVVGLIAGWYYTLIISAFTGG